MVATAIPLVYKALSDEHRNNIIWLLGKNERTAGEIENELGLSQSSTSQHLKVLREAGLVVSRKHGNFRIYSLKKAVLQEALSYFDRLWDHDLTNLKNHLEQSDEERY